MQLSERLLTPESERTPDVVSNILRKRDLLLAGDPAHEEIKTALVIGSGAMRGAYSGGVVIGLEELGLTDTFDDVVGVSVGASTAAYFLANQSARGTSLFFEELTTKHIKCGLLRGYFYYWREGLRPRSDTQKPQSPSRWRYEYKYGSSRVY
jgi:predicted acylesterase/phospholipase RssA